MRHAKRGTLIPRTGADTAMHGRVFAGVRRGRVARLPVRVECAVLAVSRGCVLNYRSPQALRTLLARIGLKVERNLPRCTPS